MLREPENIGECVYFTLRGTGGGKIKCWVPRENCPKCGKGLMGKPKDEKTGKIKTRATEYVCPKCGYTVEKEEYEESLTANIKYTCPNCKFEGEIQIPFKRKNVSIFDESKNKKVKVKSLRFQCEKCEKDIDIVKWK